MSLISPVYADELGKIAPSNILTDDSGIWTPTGGFNWGNIGQWIVSMLFAVAAVLCLIFLIWGGVSFITSGGDSSKVASARNRMIFSAIGMIVVGASFAIWNLVMNILGITELNFGL